MVATTRTMTLTSEGRDPESGQVIKSRMTGRYVDDDHRVVTMHMLPEGEDGPAVKIMEISYTRKK